MTRVPRPTRIEKLTRNSVTEVADHGVFTVSRLGYPSLPREVFVFSCPDWCNVVAETPDGQVVLVWQYRFGTDALSLEIPGGVIDPGETPEEAARRELREETGYEADTLELLGVVEPNPALQGNRSYTFFAPNARLAGSTSFDDLEDLEVALVKKEDVTALVDEGEITHALVVTALEAYARKKLGAAAR